MQKLKFLFASIISLVILLVNAAPAHALGVGENCTAAPTTCTPPLTCKPFSPGSPISTCQASSGLIPGGGSDISTAWRRNFIGTLAPLSFGDFVTRILPQIYTIALILVLIYLVWGSYKYLISGGDPKAVQAAKAHLTWAVVGMIFVFLSYGIFQLVSALLGNIY
jgi:hypothetical protein